VQGRSPLRVEDPEDRVASVMAEHGRTLLRTANHFSLCHDDALDAYQRALEIFIRRADRVLPETEAAWLKVVVKHEALAIRRARSESVSGEEPDLDARSEPTARPLDEHAAGDERVSRSAEALRALKPDERRALMLKAQGYSYDEIGARLGWTYTKVNRCITEGRRRFMKVFAAIESGEACEQYVSMIAALAGGTASSADVLQIRPHLRHCAACRATVRQLHVPAGTRLKLLLPGFLLAPVASMPDGVKLPEQLATRDDDIVILPPPDGAAAAAGSGGDAPAAHAIDLAGHLQLPLDLPERVRGTGLGRAKEHAYALLHRTQSSDAAAGAYIASSAGGGRITTIATIIGFCVSGAGAGALCVATGVVQTPGWILDGTDRAPAPRPAAKAKPPRAPKPRGAAELTASSRATEVIATPTPAPTSRPVAPKPRPKRPTATQDPSQGTTPASHENAPISEAPTGTTAEFGPESGGSTTSSAPPASAPATGGGEFLP
jgi:RNA polymerase sigma factor (sigma-70 family)